MFLASLNRVVLGILHIVIGCFGLFTFFQLKFFKHWQINFMNAQVLLWVCDHNSVSNIDAKLSHHVFTHHMHYIE